MESIMLLLNLLATFLGHSKESGKKKRKVLVGLQARWRPSTGEFTREPLHVEGEEGGFKPYFSAVDYPEKTVGESLLLTGGREVKFLEILLCGTLSAEQVRTLLGPECPEWELDRKGDVTFPCSTWLKSEGDERYKITFGTLLPAACLESILRKALHGANVSIDRVLPWYPSWLVQREGSVLFVPILPAKDKVQFPATWTEKDRLKMLVRLGKDLWASPITGVQQKKVLVVPAGNGWDGSIHLKPGVAGDKAILVRGMVEGHPWTIVKGRLLASRLGAVTPDGQELPESIDGWTTEDQFKGVTKPKAGSIVLLSLYGIKDEQHKELEEGEHEKQSQLSILAMLLGRWSPETLARMDHDFGVHAAGVAARMTKTRTITEILKEYTGEEDAGVSQSMALKESMGLASDAERERLWLGRLSKVKSLPLKRSAYPLVFFAPAVGGVAIQPGCPAVNDTLASWLAGHGAERFTVARYPLVSYQSLYNVSLGHVVHGVLPGTPVIWMHPDDAKYLQGDDDDHLLLMLDYMSEFQGGEKPVQGRDFPMRTNVTTLGAYLAGWHAQSQIGWVFNQMVSTLGFGVALGWTSEKLTAETSRIGGLLDILAQGVKKPYDLEGLALGEYETLGRLRKAAKKAKVVIPPTYEIARNGLRTGDKAAAFLDEVKAAWGVTLPGPREIPREELRLGATPRPGAVESATIEGLKCRWTHEGRAWWAARLKQALSAFPGTESLRDWHKSPDAAAMLRVLATMAGIANGLPVGSAALEAMDGVWLAASQLALRGPAALQ